MYTWSGMKKLTWNEVEKRHQNNDLIGVYKLYPNNTESLIMNDYTWEEILNHVKHGGELGEEVNYHVISEQ